uniref:Phosphoserine phosphatase n=1 Tax=Ficedula albicollis TaxID=59894 RepID=A0A803VJA0_FICAL
MPRITTLNPRTRWAEAAGSKSAAAQASTAHLEHEVTISRQQQAGANQQLSQTSTTSLAGIKAVLSLCSALLARTRAAAPMAQETLHYSHSEKDFILSPHSKKAPKRMASLMELKEIFRSADAVCFDVDSTVIREEGIDELAKFCGVGDAVAEMTRRAMGGTVTFKAALTARLGLIRPSYEQVQKLISDNPPQLTPGIRELVSRLHQRGVQVFLVSGGFQSIVEHVALQLNIPTANVFANRLKFYFNGFPASSRVLLLGSSHQSGWQWAGSTAHTGEYAGFDETQPTAESGGKGKVITHLKEQFHFKKVVMIGDGATDMEACPPGDCFIGFGGNVVRKQVKEKAKWYITHFDELLKELEER